MRTLFVLLFAISCVAVEKHGSSVSGDCEELFLNQLDKATSSVDESAYRQCSNEHWPNKQDSKICVSCYSVYELCGTALIYVSGSFNWSLNLTFNDNNGTDRSKSSVAEAYGYGTIMVCAVSALSLLGLFLVPCLNQNRRLGRFVRRYVLTMLTAMGVSALLCDVLFELIPTIFHATNDTEGKLSNGELIGRATGLVAGVFIFYLLEIVLHTLVIAATKKSSINNNQSSNNFPDEDPLVIGQEEGIEAFFKSNDESVTTVPASNSKSTFRQKYLSFKHIRPLAWIIIIGELLHNAADGITLGVAISQSVALGFSTAIAICLHEIPHEMADFGILVKSGMHWLTALIFNFLSSLSAFAGFYIGVAVSTDSTAAKEWLLSIASGSFLYIALADLLPELKMDSSHHHELSDDNVHSRHKEQAEFTFCEKIAYGFVICVGFLFAFAVLLTISLNEDNINNLFSSR